MTNKNKIRLTVGLVAGIPMVAALSTTLAVVIPSKEPIKPLSEKDKFLSKYETIYADYQSSAKDYTNVTFAADDTYMGKKIQSVDKITYDTIGVKLNLTLVGGGLVSNYFGGLTKDDIEDTLNKLEAAECTITYNYATNGNFGYSASKNDQVVYAVEFDSLGYYVKYVSNNDPKCKLNFTWTK